VRERIIRHLPRARGQLLVVEQGSAAAVLFIAVAAVVLPMAAEAPADVLAAHAKTGDKRSEIKSAPETERSFVFGQCALGLSSLHNNSRVAYHGIAIAGDIA
jgi:hypothetical protein